MSRANIMSWLCLFREAGRRAACEPNRYRPRSDAVIAYEAALRVMALEAML